MLLLLAESEQRCHTVVLLARLMDSLLGLNSPKEVKVSRVPIRLVLSPTLALSQMVHRRSPCGLVETLPINDFYAISDTSNAEFCRAEKNDGTMKAMKTVSYFQFLALQSNPGNPSAA